MKHFIVLLLLPAALVAQKVQSVSVYELSEMTGQQVYFASHIKAESLKDARMDDEDRAALNGAIGPNTGSGRYSPGADTMLADKARFWYQAALVTA